MPAYRWVSLSAGQSLPRDAVKGGRDSDGSVIYVGRSSHAGDVLPAKIIPARSIAYVSWNGGEHPKHQFEVLCGGNYVWEYRSNGLVPSNAVVAGKTSSGETLYIGRAHHAGTLTVGKVQPSNRCLFIPYDGEEHCFEHYEVLVSQ